MRHHRLCVAGVQIELRFAGNALEPAVLPALAHLLQGSADMGAADIVFDLWEGATTGVTPPRPPFTRTDYHRYGLRASVDAGPYALMHAANDQMIFAYDRDRRQGLFWTSCAEQFSIYDRAAPLQTLFHWALAEYGWQVLHAAAVGTQAGGVLLIGNTGAGKSTTALGCLGQTSIKLLCDDKCLVRREPAPQAFALFSSGKIKGDMLDRLPNLRPLLAGWDESYKADKGLVFLHPTYGDDLVSSFPVKALVLPKVAHRAQASIEAATAVDVFRSLGPSTVIWLPGAEAENLRFTASLARSLPCYRLELAGSPQRNCDAILQLLAAI